MRSDFEKAIGDHNPLYREGIQDQFYKGADWAWQHQQTKVDELQKWLDAVKQLIQEYHQHSYREADDFVFYLEQALKGESNG